MTKPDQFQEAYVSTRDLPYEMSEGPESSTYTNGGVLGRGKIVWMERPSVEHARSQEVAVFAEDLGIIFLNPRLLTRIY